MTSRFAVLEVRPSGKEACRTAQDQAGGRGRWNGVLPLRTLLVEQPDEAAEPTGYWMTNLPVATPIADLVRWAKMRWRCPPGPAAVLGRHLHHLRPPTEQNQSQNLTKYY
ncbi:hypothetical protein [Streptomyces sp. PSKA30]|uniref:hypothetical protein n=1 Tax=Streptomyces sp. PSKA30 TaxID=2874597 RepID=UPI0027E043CA|nr:hypothetical protein [Streptomyces sp. PSKA30]